MTTQFSPHITSWVPDLNLSSSFEPGCQELQTSAMCILLALQRRIYNEMEGGAELGGVECSAQSVLSLGAG